MQCAKNWRVLFFLQYQIAGVIALGMIEGCTWYFYWLVYNMEGETRMPAFSSANYLDNWLHHAFSHISLVQPDIRFGSYHYWYFYNYSEEDSLTPADSGSKHGLWSCQV